MSGKHKELTGIRFGKLIAIEFVGHNKRRNALWKCRCDCGNIVVKDSNSLKRLLVRSCGCLRKEVNTVSNKKPKHLIHGCYRDRIYRIYASIKTRCFNEKNKDYINYGGRGIKMCDEWNEDFLTFKKWAENNGYEESLSIDRIDVNGNYEPSNCRWATGTEQQNNKRNNRIVEIDGVEKTVTEWCVEKKIGRNTVYGRIKNRWDIIDALCIPVNRRMK